MSAQSLQQLNKPFSDLAINPLKKTYIDQFITWLNGYTTSDEYKLSSVPSKLSFLRDVRKKLITIIENIGNPGVGAGTAATTKSRELYRTRLESLADFVLQKELRLYVLPEAVPAPPTKDMYSSVDTDARLGEIQQRLLEFKENQLNHGKFTKMASKAFALIAELHHIQETLPSSDTRLKFTISELIKALKAWQSYFETTAAPLVRAPMVRAPPSKEGGRKTRKHKRRRKRKTRKHGKKKRTRRRKPKKRHRRTRKK